MEGRAMRGCSGVLATLLLVLACAPAAGPKPSAATPAPPADTGAAPVAAMPAGSAASALPAGPAPAAPPAGSVAAAASPGPPERGTVRIGLPVDASTFLPVYLAAERTAQEEGLT